MRARVDTRVLRRASGGGKACVGSSRRPNARTGRHRAGAFAELVKAHKRGDRAALGRVADRMGLVRLGEAVASAQPGVGEAALSAAPLARGGVLLIGAATDQIASSDWSRAAAAAHGARGACSTARCRRALEEWEVPPDVVARACTSLRALAWRSDAALATRLAALDAVAAAAPSCGSGADLAPLARDSTATAAARGDDGGGRRHEREALLRDAIADADRSVSTAGDGGGVPARRRAPAPAARRNRPAAGAGGGARAGGGADDAARRCGGDARLSGRGGNAAGSRAAR